MTPLEIINPVSVDEVPGWARAMATTFLGDPSGREFDRRTGILERRWQPERAWGARDRGSWVATLRTEPRRITIPAAPGETRELTVDALTNVTVAATHRRRGLMSEMLGRSLHSARERGDALSVLIAAEWPIYGRFGYAPSVLSANYVLHPRRLARCDFGTPSALRPVDPAALGGVVEVVFEAMRRRDAGQMDRGDDWWASVIGTGGHEPSPTRPPVWLVHESDQGPDGYLAWKATGDFSLAAPVGKVDVWELAAASDTAYRDLWAYLAGIDGVDEIRVPARPVDEPVRWLLSDGRALQLTEQVDFLWLRILDVGAALRGRAYAMPGSLVLEVRDEAVGGFATGRWALETDGVGAECEPTQRSPDLELSQPALAAIYLGGYRLMELVLAGGVRERTPGALMRAAAMFSTARAPWNATWF